MLRRITALLFSLSLSVQAAPLALDWLDLVPAAERNAQTSQPLLLPAQHEQMRFAQSMAGSMRPELDQQTVQLTGYVVPLEGDFETVTEFLLVPFVGACVHVPPPPPNQLVHVVFEKGVAATALWDAVVVEGVLSVENSATDLAETGYQLRGQRVSVLKP